MKTRGGKREGARQKKLPALAKITREISKSPLYIFRKSALSQPGGKVCAGTFVTDSNFVSWQSEMRLHDFYGS